MRSHASRAGRLCLGLCLFLFGWHTLCLAVTEITTLNGLTYRAVKVTKVEPDGIRILHAGGAAKIKFRDLPQPLREQWGYDPFRAAEYEEEQLLAGTQGKGSTATDETVRRADTARRLVLGTVSEKMKGGLLVFARQPDVWSRFERTPRAEERLEREKTSIPPGTLPDHANAYIGRHWIRSADDLLAMFTPVSLLRYKDNDVERHLPPRIFGSLFLKNHPDEAILFLENIVCIYAYPDGEHSYPSTYGTATVPAYNVILPDHLTRPEPPKSAPMTVIPLPPPPKP
jgi:hypothetical protein